MIPPDVPESIAIPWIDHVPADRRASVLADPELVRLFDYMKRHPGKRPVALRLAEHLGTTEQTLRRHFERRVGIPFGRFVSQGLADAAVETRSRVHCRVKDVALGLGYKRQDSLARLVRKRRDGRTPGSFRPDPSRS